MADRATKCLSVEEFLDWNDGTDTRHMLVDGVIVAMAPTSHRHGRIAGNAGLAIGRRMGSDCSIVNEAGLALAADTCVIADVAMTCEPPGEDHLIASPALVVEVLSPSNARDDRGLKVPGYQTLPSVREIWLIDSSERAVQVWRRREDGWLQTLPIRAGSFRSDVLDADISVDELYARTGL